MVFRSFNAGPAYVDAALAIIRHTFNIRASERNRKSFPRLGHYDHHIIDRINDISLKINGQPLYKWWSHLTHVPATSCTYGITPCVPEDQYENVTEDIIKNYPPIYKTIARKTKTIIPYMPVHSKDEFLLFRRNIQFYVGRGLGEKSTKANFDSAAMTNDWNNGNLNADRGKFPSITRDIQITRKLEENIVDAYNVQFLFICLSLFVIFPIYREC